MHQKRPEHSDIFSDEPKPQQSYIGLIAMGVKDWTTFHMAAGFPLLGLLVLFFILPESPRWLIAKKKYTQARATIEKAAKINGVRQNETQYQTGIHARKNLSSLQVTIPEDLLTVKKEVGVELETTESSSLGTSVLFTHPAMRKAILIMWINWIVTTLGKNSTCQKRGISKSKVIKM